MSNTDPVIPEEYRERYEYAIQLLINLLGRREEFASIWDQYTQEVADIERIAHLTSDLAAANLRVEGLEKEVEEAKAGESFQSGILWNAYQAAGRTDLTLSGWLNFLVAENAALNPRVEQLSGPVTDEELMLRESGNTRGWFAAILAARHERAAMSEPVKRYMVKGSWCDDISVAFAQEEMVLHSDYARLEQERDRLRKALVTIQACCANPQMALDVAYAALAPAQEQPQDGGKL